MTRAVPLSGLEVHWLENGPIRHDGPSQPGVLAMMVLDRNDPE